MTNVNCYWLGSILRELEVNTTENTNNTHSEVPMGDWAPVSRDPIGQFLAPEFLQEETILLSVFNESLFAKLDSIVVLYLNKNP